MNHWGDEDNGSKWQLSTSPSGTMINKIRKYRTMIQTATKMKKPSIETSSTRKETKEQKAQTTKSLANNNSISGHDGMAEREETMAINNNLDDGSASVVGVVVGREIP
jgi:hypothetical protein